MTGLELLANVETIIKERGASYGDMRETHERIARYWQARLHDKIKPGYMITAEDVVHCMIGLKQARLLETPNHEDSLQDLIGYAVVAAEVAAKP